MYELVERCFMFFVFRFAIDSRWAIIADTSLQHLTRTCRIFFCRHELLRNQFLGSVSYEMYFPEFGFTNCSLRTKFWNLFLHAVPLTIGHYLSLEF